MACINPLKFLLNLKKKKTKEILCQISTMFSEETNSEIDDVYKALKSEEYDLPKFADWGESALKSGTGPAAPLIACQAGTLFHLCGLGLSFQEGYDAARKVLQEGFCYQKLMQHIDSLF